MILTTASTVTLPNGVTLKNFDWYFEKIEINLVAKTCEVCVRCTANDNKAYPEFFYFKVSNIVPGTTLLELVNKAKLIIPNSILKS